MTDKEIENLWDDLTDIPFYEDDNGYCLYDNLYLDVDWYIYKKDTSRDIIWHWFDKNYSKGVAYLLNEYTKY